MRKAIKRPTTGFLQGCGFHDVLGIDSAPLVEKLFREVIALRAEKNTHEKVFKARLRYFCARADILLCTHTAHLHIVRIVLFVQCYQVPSS